ncbi:MAG: hypothetical protein JST26_17065 [Bacteroidetes bacterium]|nr:hypothetical protein [Bacteroidota bacterium]
MKTSTKKTLLWLSLFAIAMGFLETSVVVYLRELYYPQGFNFPLVIIPNKIAVVEFWREFATIIMLIGAGYMCGHNRLTRFAYFLIAFAIWDIFYYIFLYILIQWPQSLFTWDILFLIPVPWTGPVIAPCLVASGLIVFGLYILYFTDRLSHTAINPTQWMLLILGVVVVILSFVWDYLTVAANSGSFIWTIHSDSSLFEELKSYVPNRFNWLIFSTGMVLSAVGTYGYIRSNLAIKPVKH